MYWYTISGINNLGRQCNSLQNLKCSLLDLIIVPTFLIMQYVACRLLITRINVTSRLLPPHLAFRAKLVNISFYLFFGFVFNFF